MEILICQACGIILRQSKTCKGCGAHTSKHSPTSLNADLGSDAVLHVSLKNDPMVIERTVNRLMYEEQLNNGNGSYSDFAATAAANFFPKVDGKIFKLPDNIPTLSPRNKEPAENGAESEPSASSDSMYDFHGNSSSAPVIENSLAIIKDDYESAPVQEESQVVKDFHFPFAVEADPSDSTKRPSPFDAPGPSDSDSQVGLPSASDETNSEPVGPSNTASFEPGNSKSTSINPENSEPASIEPGNSESASIEPGSTLRPLPVDRSAPDGSPAVLTGVPPAPTSPEPTVFLPGRELAPAADSAAPFQASLKPSEPSPTVQDPSPTQDKVPARDSKPEPSPEPEKKEEEPASPKPVPKAKPSSFNFFAEEPAQKKVPEDRTQLLDSSKERPSSESASFIPDLEDKVEENEKPSKKKDKKEINKEIKNKNKKDKKKSKSEKDDSSDEKEAKESDSKDAESESGDTSSAAALKKKERRDRFSKNKNQGREPEQIVQIGPLAIKKSVLVTTAVLLVFAGFPTLVLICNVLSIVGSLNGGSQPTASAPAVNPFGSSQPQAAQPTQNGITGKWEILFQNARGGVGRGIMEMTQTTDKFTGWGIDNNGQFQVAGSVLGPTVTFTKQYVQGNQPIGKPIQYQGALSTVTDKAGKTTTQINGMWTLSKREGYSWRAQVVTLSGKFQCRFAGAIPGVAAQSGDGNANNASNAKFANKAEAPKDPRKAHDFFLQVALGIVGLGVALAVLSLKFFGPSGLLNIWAKKEYIPSQFKSQHFSMVKEMGKPIRVGGLPLGQRVEWGWHQFWLPKKLNLPLDIRDKNPHMLVVGAGATGKSRLVASFIAQDIESNDRAVVLVDSDGALADLVLDWIASRPNGADMAKRVIVVDPTNPQQSLAYNPLEFPADGDLQNCASAVVFGFKAAYTEPPGAQSQWNQQTANILRNSAVLLMANNKTLTDLPVLLSDNDFRDLMLEKVEKQKQERSEYITLVDAWTNYKRLARTDQWITWIEPILNRVQPMLSDPRLRSILTPTKSELDLQLVISKKQVLIVKIPQGNLDRNGNLLGSLLVAGVKQAALSLSSHRRGLKQRPVALYLDELESFIEKETFDSITTETRKLQIGFCGACKTLQIIPEDFRNKLIINCGIIAIFALAKKDADMLGPQMFRVDGRKVKHQTIQNVFNKVNSSPQFELIMDEEKLNIDRVVGQEKRTYFCYRVGSVAGVFSLKSPDFPDLEETEVNAALLDRMRNNRQEAMAADLLEDENDEEDEDEDEAESPVAEDEPAEKKSRFNNQTPINYDSKTRLISPEKAEAKPQSKSEAAEKSVEAGEEDEEEEDDDDDEDDEDDDDDDDGDEADDDDDDEDEDVKSKAKSSVKVKKKK